MSVIHYLGTATATVHVKSGLTFSSGSNTENITLHLKKATYQRFGSHSSQIHHKPFTTHTNMTRWHDYISRQHLNLPAPIISFLSLERLRLPSLTPFRVKTDEGMACWSSTQRYHIASGGDIGIIWCAVKAPDQRWSCLVTFTCYTVSVDTNLHLYGFVTYVNFGLCSLRWFSATLMSTGIIFLHMQLILVSFTFACWWSGLAFTRD